MEKAKENEEKSNDEEETGEYKMSVVKGLRGESKLKVLDVMLAMTNYTIERCMNEKTFPKRERWCLTGHIANDAAEARKIGRMAKKGVPYDTIRDSAMSSLSSFRFGSSGKEQRKILVAIKEAKDYGFQEKQQSD